MAGMSEARRVKDALYARHPGSGGQMPGPWTVTEEWRGIDVLAFSAWSSASNYGRLGYEVKVSRSDLRRELLAPGKRARNVAWCNEFYFALPKGLLRQDEIEGDAPEWETDQLSFLRDACPEHCHRPRGWAENEGRLTGKYEKRGPDEAVWVECSACEGRGYLTASRAEEFARDRLWVPEDVGLILVDGRGTRLAKRSPRRNNVPALGAGELGQLVRWISLRPDPRHRAQRRELVA